MGSDMLYESEAQDKARSQWAVKMSSRLKCEMIYVQEYLSGPVEDMIKGYTGKVKLTDHKTNEIILSIPNYEDAVKLYKYINEIKKYLS